MRRIGLVEDGCIHNFINREALHLLEVLADTVIMLSVQKVAQRHEWFALCRRAWNIDRLSDSISTESLGYHQLIVREGVTASFVQATYTEGK